MRARVLSPDQVEEAAEIIRAGGLVAFPTETVYGLGANALDERAVRGIFEAKSRPLHDPLIVHYAESPVPGRLGERFWPGPLTLVIARPPEIPRVVTAGRDTVAVRVPANTIALALIEASGCPIAAPSANLYSRPSPTMAQHVVDDLGDRIDAVIDGGPTTVGIESTVLDVTTAPPTILRPGGITREQLLEVLPEVAEQTATDDARSPGTAERHYSPWARVDLFDQASPEQLAAHMLELEGRGENVVQLKLPGDPSTAASRLYALLRDIDQLGADAIVANLPPPGGLGTAIRDRLRRAANGRVIT